MEIKENDDQEVPMQDFTSGIVYIDNQEIQIDPDHRQYLGISIEKLLSYYASPAYFLDINRDIYDALVAFDQKTQKEHGLYGIDYIFLSNIYLHKSLTQFEKEMRLHVKFLSNIFKRLGLPQAHKNAIIQESILKRKQTDREAIQIYIQQAELRDVSHIPTIYKFGSEHIEIQEIDKKYLGRKLEDLLPFFRSKIAEQLRIIDTKIQNLYHVSVIDYMFLQYHYLHKPLAFLASKLGCTEETIKRIFLLSGYTWTHKGKEEQNEKAAREQSDTSTNA